MRGTLAQLVEQRTENPCVPGSIPGGTTLKPDLLIGFFVFKKESHGVCINTKNYGNDPLFIYFVAIRVYLP